MEHDTRVAVMQMGEMGEQSLRQAAMTMQRLADQVAEIGNRALAEADVGWHSTAAEAFRDQLSARATAIRDCSGRLETAAHRLRWHAERCHRAQQWLQGR